MRRRTFIGTTAAAAAFAGLPSKGFADDRSEITLRALAEAVIPDIQSGAWSNGPCRHELEKRWRALNGESLEKMLSALNILDKVSGDKFGEGFSSLSLDRRTELIKGLLKDNSEFEDIFWNRVRPFFIYIYFESETGIKRIGYRTTTQFEGYPDIASYPAGREGN